MHIFIPIFVLLNAFLGHAEERALLPSNLSTTIDLDDGCQILHSRPKNKPYTENSSATLFVDSFLQTAVPCTSDAETLKYAIDHVSLDGFYLEAGVWIGRTINFIGALSPDKKIHGFDSFEGLPEDWTWGENKVVRKGSFIQEELPYVHCNVRLYKGWFKDTLPLFKETILKESPIAFLHIDCCLYSSTKDVLTAFSDNIVPGTIIAFDEFYNYPGYEEHEMKAFYEFLEEKNFKAEYLAFNINHEQVVVRIKS